MPCHLRGKLRVTRYCLFRKREKHWLWIWKIRGTPELLGMIFLGTILCNCRVVPVVVRSLLTVAQDNIISHCWMYYQCSSHGHQKQSYSPQTKPIILIHFAVMLIYIRRNNVFQFSYFKALLLPTDWIYTFFTQSRRSAASRSARGIMKYCNRKFNLVARGSRGSALRVDMYGCGSHRMLQSFHATRNNSLLLHQKPALILVHVPRGWRVCTGKKHGNEL